MTGQAIQSADSSDTIQINVGMSTYAAATKLPTRIATNVLSSEGMADIVTALELGGPRDREGPVERVYNARATCVFGAKLRVEKGRARS